MKKLLSILLCVLLSLSSLPITVMAEESQTVNVYDTETFGEMPASDDKPEETTTENTTSDPMTDNKVSSFVATSDNNPTIDSDDPDSSDSGSVFSWVSLIVALVVIGCVVAVLIIMKKKYQEKSANK